MVLGGFYGNDDGQFCGVDWFVTWRDGEAEVFKHFDAAIGSRHPAAEPNPHAFEVEFEPKVKLELKRAPTSGGCG